MEQLSNDTNSFRIIGFPMPWKNNVKATPKLKRFLLTIEKIKNKNTGILLLEI